MLQLHAHNKTTYENLVKLYESHDRVAVVQPTGTGKSFVMLQLISDNRDKRFIVISPSVYIFSQIEIHAENNGVDIRNVEFITLSKLSQMTDTEIIALDCDYIIFDEFHRCGAIEWGRAVNKLLDTHRKAKVLGTSATPIRYLDNSRNMAEELFNNVYAVNMSLVEAISMGILPLPIYVTTVYSFSGDVERLRIRAENSRNPRLRFALLKKIDQAKRMLSELDCGIDGILEKHIKNKSGKYIVFCPGIDKLMTIADESTKWFENINKNIHKYSVYSENNKSRSEFELFAHDNDDTALKLLFCVDMLNEGVHIEGVEGVIMLRATKSANVFYQQLGRALACGAENVKHPIIFDIANNYESGDTADTYVRIMELQKKNGKDMYGNIEFELFDYVQDIRTILSELRNSFEGAWDTVFEALCEYVDAYETFPVYGESYDGIRLGMWCANQRSLYKRDKLSQERIDKLESIGFKWQLDEDVWINTYNEVKDFCSTHKRFPSLLTDTDKKTRHLFYWLKYQKSEYKNNCLSDDKAQLLRDIGFGLDTSRAETMSWEESFENLAAYINSTGKFPGKSDNEDTDKLLAWIYEQRKAKNKGTLSQNKIKLLDGIGFVWNSVQAKWNKMFDAVWEYIAENGKTPEKSFKINDMGIGAWYARQIKEYNANRLDPYRKSRIASLNKLLEDTRRHNEDMLWLSRYNELQSFIEEKGHIPKSKDTFSGTNLYMWLRKQGTLFANGELSEDKANMLLKVGIDLSEFSTKKEYRKVWFENYDKYFTFVHEYGRKPSRKDEQESKLYNWERNQIHRLKTGKLTDSQVLMLEKLGL